MGRFRVRMVVVASVGRVVLGAAFVVIGLLLLGFNNRVTQALVAGQRESIGALLGSRREASDRLHSSQPFLIAARVFMILFAVIWTALAVALIVTPR
jgi:hypothetical protein